MTTFLMVTCLVLLFVIVFLVIFALAACKAINELEETVANLTIEVATVGTLAADAKFACDDLHGKMENVARYGVWE